eukprot:2896045-Rhodomonas_salina.1
MSGCACNKNEMFEARKRNWSHHAPISEEDPDFYEFKCFKCQLWWGAACYSVGVNGLANGHMWA